MGTRGFAGGRAAALIIALGFAGSAFAQWQWVDGAGRRVYSDRPPPADVPARNILKRPNVNASTGTVSRTAAKPASSIASAKTAAAASAQGAASAPLSAASAAEKKKADEAVAAKKADNCQRATTARATLASGQRIATVNAKGEREFMSDAARAAELKRLDGVLASDCGNS